jgi:uncharacterized protein (TIGR02646 family)
MPPVYGNYKSYKKHLALEFRRRCAYCMRLASNAEDSGFGVDHYRPKSVFPELLTEYSNLFFCCAACNSRKRDFWPRTGNIQSGRFLPNPCDHVMTDHVRYRGPLVDGRSDAGNWAVELLDLNDADAVQLRKATIITAQAASRELAIAAEILSRMLTLRGANEVDQPSLEIDIVNQEKFISDMREALRILWDPES